MIVRIPLFLFHAFQFLFSAYSGYYVSSTIAFIYMGTYILDSETMKNRCQTYYKGPFITSIIGTLLWVVGALIDIELRG